MRNVPVAANFGHLQNLTVNTDRAATQHQQNERNLKNTMGTIAEKDAWRMKNYRSKQQALTREYLAGL